MEITAQAKNLMEAFEAAGQGQVFKFFTELGSEAQEALLAQAASIDLAEVARLVQTHVFETNACKQDLDGLDPAPYVPLPENGGDPALWDSARKVGAEAISAGRVAAFTVAGGQGTRLGYDGPKGTYPVTPVSKKTLFRCLPKRLPAVASVLTHRFIGLFLPVKSIMIPRLVLLKLQNYFGLPKERVHFIVQGLVPAVDREGKMLLSDKGTIVMTPDGHGVLCGPLFAAERWTLCAPLVLIPSVIFRSITRSSNA